MRGGLLASSWVSALVWKSEPLGILSYAYGWGEELVLLLEMVLDSLWVTHSVMLISHS